MNDYFITYDTCYYNQGTVLELGTHFTCTALCPLPLMHYKYISGGIDINID